MSDFTPLCSALSAEAAKKTLRMHMPGHKGKANPFFPYPDFLSIDYTELPGTGNLYEGIPPISDAEALLAAAVRAPQAFFLTGGATQGIMTALATVCRPGSTVIADRASHRAVWSAMVHLDLRPSFLYAGRLHPWGVTAPITAEAVAEALLKAPDAAAVILTSPTYYGVLSDISAIAEVCAKARVPLIVDEAHGAHLPYLDGLASAVAQGASLSVSSAHKTLPALTAGAYLLAAAGYDPAELRRKAALFGTSSPSYPVMASIDAARAYMEGEGGALYRQISDAVKALRATLNTDGAYAALDDSEALRIDPTRLTICTRGVGLSGFAASEKLASEHGIACEMADAANIVMIVTCTDTQSDLDRIGNALHSIRCESCTGSVSGASAADTAQAVPQILRPVPRFTPREAAYAPRKTVRLRDAAGFAAGEHLAPYPPGIPIVAAGEVLREEHLPCLEELGLDLDKEIAVIG